MALQAHEVPEGPEPNTGPSAHDPRRRKGLLALTAGLLLTMWYGYKLVTGPLAMQYHGGFVSFDFVVPFILAAGLSVVLGLPALVLGTLAVFWLRGPARWAAVAVVIVPVVFGLTLSLLMMGLPQTSFKPLYALEERWIDQAVDVRFIEVRDDGVHPNSGYPDLFVAYVNGSIQVDNRGDRPVRMRVSIQPGSDCDLMGEERDGLIVVPGSTAVRYFCNILLADATAKSQYTLGGQVMTVHLLSPEIHYEHPGVTRVLSVAQFLAANRSP